MIRPRHRRLARRLAVDRAGTTAVELALIFPVLATCIFGIWTLGWGLYLGGEARHAVELGSRVYIANPGATLSDLQTAISAHLEDLPLNSITVSSSVQAVGAASTQHIVWSYQTTASIPFVPSFPMAFGGAVDVPLATP